jgi:hypothetical protein
MAKQGLSYERIRIVSQNRWLWSALAVAALGSSGFAQAPAPISAAPLTPALISVDMPAAIPDDAAPILNLNDAPANRLRGNDKFQNFIGFISNPLQSIDPRAITEMYPLFASYHTSSIPALPSADMQLYGAGITVALSDRLSMGLNQGGYAQAFFSRNQPALFPNLAGLLANRAGYGGLREGWMNLGGFLQYTVIEDVEDQFLMTAGMRLEGPSGANQLFQGNPPWNLAPYVTVGKEIGKFHVMANVGYQVDLGSGKATLDTFYANVHIDRQCFGWLYPLVEINSSFPTSNVAVGLPTREGFIDLGNFSSTGNIVMLAAGANAVIVPNKLEFGAVYTTSIATQRNFNVDGFIVRMTLRY